jgi:hypothetical protein
MNFIAAWAKPMRITDGLERRGGFIPRIFGRNRENMISLEAILPAASTKNVILSAARIHWGKIP